MPELAATVRQLLLYTLWADRVCLQAVSQVREEDMTREAGTSFGSLLGTLAHVLGSQRLWLCRFEGKPAESAPSPAGYPDRETLQAAWMETAAELGFFLAALTPAQVASQITWTSTEGVTRTRPLWQLILHLVNHSTYHRGQAVSLLRQLGYAPPATDLLHFFIEQVPA
ncbi:MAG: DinB family protein [Acidobacteriota bacterium]|nr:DinB family protein [Acidobacteriota bacterium]